MSKVPLIIAREYLARTKKKSFIITTILMPILMALLVILPVYISYKSEREVTIFVYDESDSYLNKFQNTDKMKFVYPSGDLALLQKQCIDGQCDVVLQILGGSQSNLGNLYFYHEPPISLQGNIEEQMDHIIFDKTLIDTFHIDLRKYNTIKQHSKSSLVSLQIDENGKAELSTMQLNRVVGIICGFLIYFFVYLYANQVLQSTMEEKTNRIAEIIISSVKPIQFMMGKIIGIALVGITQFLIQIVAVVLILFAVQMVTPAFFSENTLSQSELIATSPEMALADSGDAIFQNGELMNSISAYYSFPFSTIIICFFFYFLFGYLMYAALFAGVGSATDTETDSQQLILPISIPLLLSLIVVLSTTNMQSEWVRWLSIIPFTSPVAMMFRLPSGVPVWELTVSMVLLLVFWILSLWFSAKVYRTGILMYGKKTTWKELWKWFKTN